MSQIVKKGLRCHATPTTARYCMECPYAHSTACGKELSSDALAYIETLEARLAETEAKLKEKDGMTREAKVLLGVHAHNSSASSCDSCPYAPLEQKCLDTLMKDAEQLIREGMGKGDNPSVGQKPTAPFTQGSPRTEAEE